MEHPIELTTHNLEKDASGVSGADFHQINARNFFVPTQVVLSTSVEFLLMSLELHGFSHKVSVSDTIICISGKLGPCHS